MRKEKSGRTSNKELSTEYPVLPNLLNRDFKQNIPGKVLLTDITYLFYGFYTKIQYIEEGFLVSEKIGS